MRLKHKAQLISSMAASKRYFPRANYRFLQSDHQSLSKDSMMFELDESDVWNTTPQSPSSRTFSRKPAVIGGGVPASLPVNVPDWSKILKDEYRDNSRRSDDDYEDDEDVEAADSSEGKRNRIPPHEFLARTRIASFSVHEGVGRTLKGRDLSRVRNAIWQRTGFQD